MFWRPKLGYNSERLDNYEEELQKGNYKAIPWIFCVFAENSREHKLKAAKMLNDVLNSMSFNDVCRMDIHMRQTTSMEWTINWTDLEIRSFFTPQMSDDEKRAVCVFSSFHPNGYLREKAVQLLFSLDETLPYIALRTNDWVTQVRQYAQTAFRDKIKVVNDVELLKTMPFLEKLRRCNRVDYHFLSNAISEKIHSPHGREALIKGLQSNEIHTRRLCLDMLLHIQPSEYPLLVLHLKTEKEPFLRQKIYLALINSGTDVSDISLNFLKDRCPNNRVIALQYLLDHNNGCILQVSMDMLMDTNARVRGLTQNIVSKLSPSTDIHRIYIEALVVKPEIAISGLGETGTIEDCGLIEPYLNSEQAILIRTSMSILARLDIKTYKVRIIEMLLSPYPGVVKKAKMLIEKYGIQDFDRIYEIFQTTKIENTRLKCAALLFTAPKWQRLIYMLQILQSNEESLRLLSVSAIRGWIVAYNRSCAQTTEKERQEIIRLVNVQQEQIGVATAKQLLFLAKF